MAQEVVPLRPGPHNPITEAPALQPASTRRAWNIDIAYPDGLMGEVIVVDVRGRDTRATADGAAEVTDELSAGFEIQPATNTITRVDVRQSSAPLEPLLGIGLRGGYTRELAARLPEQASRRRSLCFSALEDLSGAHFVSGYAHLIEGIISQTPEHADMAAERQADICIGWAADGPFIASTRARGHIPVPVGPTAPDIDNGYEMATMIPPTVRRQRRIDVVNPADATGEWRLQEHFRDSYAGRDGEMVMHEYLVDAVFDRDGRVVSIAADPRVLPWSECPGAAASAQRLVGQTLGELPARVRADLVGATTCTHLNSTLRTLADAEFLA
jgi:hypothetical protein